MKTAGYCLTLAVLAIISVACKPEPPKETPKLYKLYGRIVRLDPETTLASIRHEKIEGWMGGMTMQFPVESATEYRALRVDEKITATVNVTSEGFWLTNVKELKQEESK